MNIEMNASIEALKACCDRNCGELSEVLIYARGRYFVVCVDSFDDCMNDRIYAIDSRYNVKIADIEKWYLLRA